MLLHALFLVKALVAVRAVERLLASRGRRGLGRSSALVGGSLGSRRVL